MQKMVTKILNSYGVVMELKQENYTLRFHGFLQPVRSKSWQYLEGDYSPLGEVPRGQYVYIGPGSLELTTGATLCVAGKEYLLRKIEPVLYGEEVAYRWGMCVEKGGEDTWGQS